VGNYQADLAYIHHQGFSGFALNAAPGLLALLRGHGIDHGLVVDLGCGSGVWARQLGFAGYDALGIDVSPAMIALARQTAPKARFRTGSAVNVKLPRCDAVTAIGECLSYAFAGDTKGSALDAFLRRVHGALRSGGVFIFDFAKPGREPGGMPRKGHWSGPDWTVLVEGSTDPGGETATRKIVTFRKTGRNFRRSEEVHKLRIFKPERLAQALTNAGFEARLIRRYGAMSLVRNAGFVGVKV
jgi:SAM-dependent methyltransferase